MEEQGTEVGQPKVFLWLDDDWAKKSQALLQCDSYLTPRLKPALSSDDINGPGIVVLDETTIRKGVSELLGRPQRLPILVLLNEVSVQALYEIFGFGYMDIIGFFPKGALESDIVERGRLVAVLREELGAVSAGEEQRENWQAVGARIRRGESSEEELSQITSLFVDPEMRRFLHELGQVLDRVKASPLRTIGDTFWTRGHNLHLLFHELGRYASGEKPLEGSRQPGQTLDEFLSDQSKKALEDVTTMPKGTESLPRLHILVRGDTGTGKTLVARWIARYLGQEGRFQHLNVSAVPPTLLESELFGSVRGAFTDAPDRPGALVTAYGGVVFLDEIGDLPMEVQSKLLVYLDSYVFKPLGWPSERNVIAPSYVVAATNRPLQEKIKAGEFREDLYHRFLYKVHVPPLRERKADLPLLADLVLQDSRVNEGRRIQGISRRALRALEGYRFPGNFRELEDVLGRACMMTAHESGDIILEKHIYRAIMEVKGRLE